MKNYKNKVYLFLYASLAIVLVSFTVLFLNFRRQVSQQNKILVIEKNLIQTDSLVNNVLEIEADKRGFQLTGDVTYLRDFYHIKTGCRNNIERLRRNMVTKNDFAFISRVDSLMQLRLADIDSGIALFRNNGTEAAVAYMQQSGNRNIRNQLTHELSILKNKYQEQLGDTTMVINEMGYKNVGGLLILLLVFVALMLVAAKTFRRAQKKMLLNHLKFKQAQQIARIGSWEWEFSTGKMKWSQEQFRLFGVDRKTFVPTYDHYLSFLNSIEQKRTTKLVNDVIDGLAEFSIEHEIIRQDGSRLMVMEQGTVLFDEKTGIPRGMFGTTQDITEAKKAEQELLLARKKSESIVNNSTYGIYQSTTSGRFIMVNPAMAGIFGYESPEEMKLMITNIGEQIYADPEERNSMAELMKEYGQVQDYEVQVLTKEKNRIWVRASIRFVQEDGGYFEGTLEDITEKKAAQEEIMQLNRSLDQFANITAHDLQEPIRMVSGFLGLLDKKFSHQIDEQGRSYILRAKDGADRMSILIRDLLEYSRSGNKASKVEPIDLNYVLDLVHQDMEIVMEKSGAELYIPNSLPVVEGAQSAIYRLFLNLVSNGIKFCKKGGTPVVTIKVEEEKDHWLFSVEDNGIGIAPADQPKLFQAFHRLHRREEYPGTGLGLVTCKKIVEMHGGNIWMTSEPGVGTCFHFTLSKSSGDIAIQPIGLRRA